MAISSSGVQEWVNSLAENGLDSRDAEIQGFFKNLPDKLIQPTLKNSRHSGRTPESSVQGRQIGRIQ
ncbi:MAG: hypothetical protein ACKN9T_17785 [Candidatus Methylumidiphilus sp.]